MNCVVAERADLWFEVWVCEHWYRGNPQGWALVRRHGVLCCNLIFGSWETVLRLGEPGSCTLSSMRISIFVTCCHTHTHTIGLESINMHDIRHGQAASLQDSGPLGKGKHKVSRQCRGDCRLNTTKIARQDYVSRPCAQTLNIIV